MEQNHNMVEHELKDEKDVDDGENLAPGSYEILLLEKEEILAPHTHFCTICGKGFKRDANLRIHMRGHSDEYKTPAALAKPHKESASPKLIKRYYSLDKWLCSCSTTFSRKDKLFGRIALFQGHTPAIPLDGNTKGVVEPPIHDIKENNKVVYGEHEMMCLQSEREALLQFKAALVDRYGMLSSWNNNSDCCQWKGIRCSNLTRHILMIDLHGDISRQRYISGEIHKSLTELRQLKYLNLSLNSFLYKEIPEFLGSLTNLRYLDLSSCLFGGKVPTQFGSLTHLKYLNLAKNFLEGSISSQIGKLSNLQHLNLRGNSFEGHIPSQLGNLSKLQYLDLNYNSFEGKIPSQLGNLSKLQQLYLGGLNGALRIHDGNQLLSNLISLTHLSFLFIPNLDSSHNWLKTISKLPNLRELSLIYCSLSDQFILSLRPSKFNFSTSLLVLDLSGNSFTSSMIFHRLSNITSNLVELDLSDNKFKSEALKSSMNICTLHSLKMRGNNFTEDLPSILHNLSIGCVGYSLQELDLSYNQIIGPLPDLSVFSSLKTLDLSENQLSGKLPEGKLPSQLESLSIRSNTIEGGIPISFRNACALRSLDMSNNSLSEEFPMLIHHLSGCARYSLEELYLDLNQINGTLPDLSMFLSLRILYLHENKLNGEIPKNFQFPHQLERLDMHSNSLKGVLTDYHFANMSKLDLLDLSDSSLTLTFSQNWVPPFQLQNILLRSCMLGPAFPKWLQTQNIFSNLDISNCSISDFVPEWIWVKMAIQGMESMDISFNNLKGTIPNLSLEVSSTFLTLASNQFEGPIPPFLRGIMLLDVSKNNFSDSSPFLCANGTVETLSQLDLSNNQLSGQIPDCWSHFKSLAYLDLSHNNFSGKIPISMGSLLELQALRLRNNNLTDNMPFFMSNCKKLVMLDVGENALSGTIPSWTGSRLQELRMLSIQGNQFSGSVPLEICYLQRIQILDLSLNNLSGQIPKCFKNFSSMAQNTFLRDDSRRGSIVGNTKEIHFVSKLDFVLMWKGSEQIFTTGLPLLNSIDLSSNHFSKEIPQEIENLVGLISLNLSRNNLTGKIPTNIGRLTSLEFLDLSRNQISGSIPSSLAKIDRLTMLDLSHNYLSGEIPTSTQLQSYNATSYEDNLNLCGDPLDKCTEEKPQHNPEDDLHNDESLFITHGFYISMALGFIIGFWGSFGSILIKRSWRHAYFKFLNNLRDNIYAMVAQ